MRSQQPAPENPRIAMYSRRLRRAIVGLLFAICWVPLASTQNSSDDQQSREDRQSCQRFVQHFYDWYWNPDAGHADNDFRQRAPQDAGVAAGTQDERADMILYVLVQT